MSGARETPSSRAWLATCSLSPRLLQGVSVQSCDSWLFKVGYRDILAPTTTSNCPPLAPPPLSRTIAAATAAAATAAAAAATSFAAAPWGMGLEQ